MAQVNLPSVDGITTLDQVKNALGRVNKELTWLLQNLDTRNINELNAEVIIAESITAGKLAADSVQTENLQAGAITTEKLEAGAVTADKITVDELSAISADLGTITAGLIESIQIFGSYIATRNGTYPRAEMSNTDDLFITYFDANNYIKYVANYADAPAIEFVTGGVIRARFSTLSGGLQIDSPNGTNLDGINRFQDWNKIRNTSTARTLQQDLDNIDNNIITLSSLYDSLNTRVTALENP